MSLKFTEAFFVAWYLIDYKCFMWIEGKEAGLILDCRILYISITSELLLFRFPISFLSYCLLDLSKIRSIYWKLLLWCQIYHLCNSAAFKNIFEVILLDEHTFKIVTSSWWVGPFIIIVTFFISFILKTVLFYINIISLILITFAFLPFYFKPVNGMDLDFLIEYFREIFHSWV